MPLCVGPISAADAATHPLLAFKRLARIAPSPDAVLFAAAAAHLPFDEQAVAEEDGTMDDAFDWAEAATLLGRVLHDAHTTPARLRAAAATFESGQHPAVLRLARAPQGLLHEVLDRLGLSATAEPRVGDAVGEDDLEIMRCLGELLDAYEEEEEEGEEEEGEEEEGEEEEEEGEEEAGEEEGEEGEEEDGDSAGDDEGDSASDDEQLGLGDHRSLHGRIVAAAASGALEAALPRLEGVVVFPSLSHWRRGCCVQTGPHPQGAEHELCFVDGGLTRAQLEPPEATGATGASYFCAAAALETRAAAACAECSAVFSQPGVTAADVLTVPAALSVSECAALIAHLETQEQALSYDSVDGRPDFQCDLGRSLEPLRRFLDADRLAERVWKRLRELPCAAGDARVAGEMPWADTDAGCFIRKYTPRTRSFIEFHEDQSAYTVNIALNDGYAGGDLVALLEDPPVATTLERSVGSATIHGGNVMHAVQKMQAGVRYSLIIFLFDTGERQKE